MSKQVSLRYLSYGFILLFAIVLCVGAHGCMRGAECRTDQGCEDGLLCRGGDCITQDLLKQDGETCRFDLECLRGRCIDQRCIPSVQEKVVESAQESPDTEPFSKDGGESLPESPLSESAPEQEDKCKQPLCPIWSKRFGGLLQEAAVAISTHKDGSVYITGRFTGSVRFGSKIFVAGAGDSFIAKLDKKGVIKWVDHLHGFHNDKTKQGQVHIKDIAVSSDGSVYVVGLFLGSMDTTRGILYAKNERGVRDGNGIDGFVQKRRSTGEILWTRHVQSRFTATLNGVTLDSKGYPFLIGNFIHEVQVANGQIHKGQGEGGILLQMDPNGQALNQQVFQSKNAFAMTDITLDQKDNVYITGKVQGEVSFGKFTIKTPNQGKITVPFVSKIVNKEVLWATSLQAESYGSSSRIQVNQNQEIYVVGKFGKSITLSGSKKLLAGKDNQSGFVVKLDTKGAPIWGKAAASQGSEAFSLILDKDENVVLWGSFVKSFAFGKTTLTTTISKSPYIAKISSSGDWQWAHKLGSSEFANSTDLARSSDGEIYLLGTFQGNLFWPFNTASKSSKDLKSSGNFDVFVIALH